MDKSQIIAEIQRTAKENGGIPLGQRRFEASVGIPRSAWRGRYWRNWSEAIRDAGLIGNTPMERYDDQLLVESLVKLTRKICHFPGYADLRLAREADKAFPTHSVFMRLGSFARRVELVRDHAERSSEDHDILGLLPPRETAATVEDAVPSEMSDGFVYMLKLGKHYKVGKTFSVPRRHREIALELPEKPDVVHAIRTDDPTGIEAYLHARFAARRTNGEWFDLSREDVQAFKKRKFM